jgi:hypothetical protein
MSILTFPPKPVDSYQTLVFDFISKIRPGITLSAPSVAATVWSGADDSGNLIADPATVSGTKVYQLVGGGTPGTIYKVTATVQTSDGQSLLLTGYIPVLTDPM